jgi:maltooligosyltrehalose synthase
VAPESVVETVWECRAEGLPKLYLIRQALALRARRPELFGLRGSYEPLEAQGAKAEHVVAFSRRGEVATVVPRLALSLAGDWADTTLALPTGHWRNELTGESLEARSLVCCIVSPWRCSHERAVTDNGR